MTARLQNCKTAKLQNNIFANFQTYISIIMKTSKILLLSLLMVVLMMNASPVLNGQSYENASYSDLTDNRFLNNWLVLGPVKFSPEGTTPDNAQQRAAFDKDELASVPLKGGKFPATIKIGTLEYSFKPVSSPDGIIDFTTVFGNVDYANAYALAEIKLEQPQKVVMGVGSDDGIKIFVNGSLVHSNWIARGIAPDDDIVVLDLKKGSNQILVRVQNIAGGWSFAMRKIGADILNEHLVQSSGRGDLDEVKKALENGADMNASGGIGLTPYQAAMIHGREKVMEYLKEKGAKTDVPMPSLEKLADLVFAGDTGAVPGVSVLIAKNGEILYQKGFGYADIGNRVPVTPETKFRIGSITKQFIASAILKMQEEGKLSVDDKLSKYVPGFPRGDEVTIRHLLTHTSGIHSFTSNPGFLKYVTLPTTPDAMIDTIKSHPYDFNPGEHYLYNNSGFFLLGYIIEKISGITLADYLRENLFKPLGMNNTGVYITNKLLDHEAYGYDMENGRIVKALNWDMSWAGGAGSLYSTAPDLYTWNEAVFSGKVLSPESLKAAFTPGMLNSGEKIEYGFGWSLSDYRGTNFISHGGGLHGFLSYIARQPEAKTTVIVLCNSTQPPAGINPTTNAYALAEYVLWNNMANQSTLSSGLKVDEKLLASYTGRYDYGQGMILKVTLEGNQLYSQMTGQSNFPIFPSSDSVFNWKVVDASIKFVADETGKITHAIHHQNGQEINAKKLQDEARVSVDPAIFDGYAGKFDGGNGLIINVTKESDKLYMQAAGLPKYQLIPASATEYFTEEVKARFTFKQDDAGKTNELLVVFEGQNIVAKRVTGEK
jgi:CubicO group peptidase (beta-lactamase class C family)